ncbi:MAG: hypothetical protein P8100_10755, partial [bacterium]
MNDNKETRVDRIWLRIRNNKYLAIIIVAAAIIAGIATFSENIRKIFTTVDDLIPDRQKTEIVDAADLAPGAADEGFFE